MPDIKGKGVALTGTRSATRKERSTRGKRARSAAAAESAGRWSAAVSAKTSSGRSATVSAETSSGAIPAAEAARRKRHAMLFETAPER